MICARCSQRTQSRFTLASEIVRQVFENNNLLLKKIYSLKKQTFFLTCSQLFYIDVIAYAAVGVPRQKIFIIDHRGEVRKGYIEKTEQ